MKKITAAVIAAALLLALTACGTAAETEADRSLKIVTTIFPEYDWTRELLGENPAGAELTLLLQNGVDMHSYQATVDDIVTISSCDLFIYVGGESDAWVDDALREATNADMKVLNLLDILGDAAVDEELVEGMEGDAGEGEAETDEHVWLSLRSAQLFCREIAAALAEFDPANADVYSANLEAYAADLAQLDGEYSEAVAAAGSGTLLFADRFPFRYLTDDYDLEYFAAFAGCSAETQASFETVVFLAGKADELGLPCVLIIDGSDGKLAETVAANTQSGGKQILTLNSMQSVTAEDIAGGATYLSIMTDNLEVLKTALA
ncbi:MAG: metal ABC transporter substrate-binding protein [Oscillospiraceae bacterium]|nr:metal ABC transporter substrate-binding protein [Oscillospiraceae bacterium]